MDQQAFERGQKAAQKALSGWQTMGYRSQEACWQRLLQYAQQEIQRAQERIQSPRKVGQPGAWERHLAYMQGFLSALR